MKKHDFERMLREAVLSDAEEQGRDRCIERNLEQASSASRERFLAGTETQKKRNARRAFWCRLAIRVGIALFTLVLAAVIVRAVIRHEQTRTVVDPVPAEAFTSLDSSRKHVVRVMITAGPNYIDDRTYAREDGDFDLTIYDVIQYHIQWKKDRCILTYTPEFCVDLRRHERALPYNELFSIIHEATPFPLRIQFLLCYADDPLPEEWVATLAEHNRIKEAQQAYGSFDAFYASRDAEKEIGIIEQAKHDATKDLPAEKFYLAFLHALWKNGDTDVQIVSASTGYDPHDTGYWLILNGSNGKSYRILGSAYEAGEVLCNGVLIDFR